LKERGRSLSMLRVQGGVMPCSEAAAREVRTGGGKI
jgi:hypothetical protein